MCGIVGFNWQDERKIKSLASLLNHRGPEQEGFHIAEAGKIPNLQFIKHVPFNQIDNFFRRAKVFVSTAAAEGYPNTFINACKCATAILSFSVNPDGFLDKYHCGLCANGGQDLFFRTLKDLLNPQNARKYGENGRRFVEQNNDIAKIAPLYKQFFQQITG
jgi:glycosyltransferase involved in cell wall biosynthesis